jgi:hypothetical protein
MDTEQPVVEEPKVPVPPITEEQIQEIALGMHRRQIFTTQHIPAAEWDDMVPRVFTILRFTGFGNVDTATIGMLWERLEHAGPRSINGYPIFLSMNMVSIADTEKILVIFRRLREAEQAALGKTTG